MVDIANLIACFGMHESLSPVKEVSLVIQEALHIITYWSTRLIVNHSDNMMMPVWSRERICLSLKLYSYMRYHSKHLSVIGTLPDAPRITPLALLVKGLHLTPSIQVEHHDRHGPTDS